MDGARIASYWAGRYAWALEKRNDLDREDLQQAAFLGVLRAERDYSEDKGGLVTLAGFYARNEIRELLGIRCGKLPPEMESLDEPITDESDETRLDFVADETIPEADAALLEEERKQTVRDAVDRLKPDQREVVCLRYFSGMTVKETAEEMDISPGRAAAIWEKARRNLSRDKYLKALREVNRRTNFLYGVGVARFHSTMTSAVEETVMYRERLFHKVFKTQEEEEES